MFRLLLSFMIVFVITVFAFESPPDIEWAHCYGGTGIDFVYSISETSDLGYIIAGSSRSTDGDVTSPIGMHDVWIIRIDAAGEIIWQRSYGGSNNDYAFSIIQTSDGGFIFAGETSSNDGDVSGWHEGYDDYGSPYSDAWVVRLDDGGEILWQRCLGGSHADGARSIKQTADGGYIVAGKTSSNDGDVSGWHEGFDDLGVPFSDAWVVRLDADGDIMWQNCLGGSVIDIANSIEIVPGGGYIIAGATSSNDGDVSGWHEGYFMGVYPLSDAWVVRLDDEGGIIWQNCLGGSGLDAANSIINVHDGGFIMVGETRSDDGDVSGHFDTRNYDAWVVRLDNDGEIIWQRCLGGTDEDYGIAIDETNMGNFIMVGHTLSDDGMVSGNHGSYDIWVVLLDPEGDMIWQRCYGGTHSDRASDIVADANGNIVVAGITTSDDGDVTGWHEGYTGTHRNSNYWILKLVPSGSTGDSWTVELDYGWNLVSFPFEPTTTLELLPDDIITPVFGYNVPEGRYEEATSFNAGVGYWILSRSSTSFEIHGATAVEATEIDILRGWNMIGGPYSEIPASTIEDIETVIPPVYGYNPSTGVYEETESIIPMFGYWILSTDSIRISLPD